MEEWATEGDGDRAYPIARQRPWPSQTPTLLAWLKRNRPDLFKRIGTVFFSKDFVVNRLTDQRVSEVSDMSGAGLLDLAARRYDPTLMETYGLGDCMDLLPPLIESADIAGSITEAVAKETGLAAGTPVIGGLFDVGASALGSGVTRTGSASIVAGTWSINQVVIDGPDLEGPVFMSSTFDRTRFMAMENSATSAANLESLVREFFEGEHSEGNSPFDASCALAAAIEPAADDPQGGSELRGGGAVRWRFAQPVLAADICRCAWRARLRRHLAGNRCARRGDRSRNRRRSLCRLHGGGQRHGAGRPALSSKWRARRPLQSALRPV